MNARLRFWVAAIVAPLAPPFILAGLFQLGGSSSVEALLLYSSYASYIVFVPVGLPILIILRRKGSLTASNVLITGSVVGFFVAMLIPPLLSVLTNNSVRFSFGFIPLVMTAALVVALVFSIVAGLFSIRKENLDAD